MPLKKEVTKNTAKRDRILKYQAEVQKLWKQKQIDLSHPNPNKQKFFVTFPYPYMNGALHLGHAFTLTKCDFIARYKQITEVNAFFPFAFHATGMPIAAAAQKLKYQLKQYGNPPKFPPQIIEKMAKQKKQFQFNIMKSMGIKDDLIQNFTDSTFWVKYFPDLAFNHLKSLGVRFDQRRCFYTTSLNPYYDSFIRWQFNILKSKGLIKFGKRPSIFSRKDKQICADHQRSQGQGSNPQQYTLIKMKLLQYPKKLQVLKDKPVYLVAATLRPQTMYGQTNLYVLKTGKYSAFQMKNGQIYICSQISAYNLAYQQKTVMQQKAQSILDLQGIDLLGLPLKAPLTKYQVIYSLPMMNISMHKGTGLVTSVPSDSPDDFAALTDLKVKKALRQKYGITDQMVNFQPTPIIQIPKLGCLSAPKICQELKIKGQNDRQLLSKAKQMCYTRGFYQGKIIVGQYSGKQVQQAKSLVKQKLIKQHWALSYYEPQNKVISRSGQQCVVALCDQWYINYADLEWKSIVKQFIRDKFKCNSQ